MALVEEIQSARSEIVSDGYDMSVGEIMNLYKEKEIIINPAYQRLFRWDDSRKTKFIESILLGIPTPPIFVYQNDDGKWELIDGLQRLSTIFQFTGLLKSNFDGEKLILEGTKMLPSLQGAQWDTLSGDGNNATTKSLQLIIKRARIRVEILKKESDINAKYEVFQRLNTGGLELSEQEVRDCVSIMINNDFYDFITLISSTHSFTNNTNISEEQTKRGYRRELALRLIVYRNVPYTRGLDVHEYLGEALIEIASNKRFPYKEEVDNFRNTFHILDNALNGDAFKRYDGSRFMGKFSLSAFEVIAYGVSLRIDKLTSMPEHEVAIYIKTKVQELWTNEAFIKHSGSGVRGTTRLINLLPLAESYF